MTVGMEHLKRGNVFVLNFLCLYGMVLGQYMQCPAGDWTVGSTVTLRCYLPKNIYPALCATGFTDEVAFYKHPFNVANTKCTLSSVSTAFCSSSSSDCSCESGNSTHYSLQSTFTVDTEDAGTWKCIVNCFNAALVGQLTFDSDNCDDKDVVADVCLNETCNDHGTCNRATGGTCECDPGYEGENCADLCLNKTCNGHGTCNRTTNGTCDCDPGYEGENCTIHHCKCCECSNCKDTGGCWGCIFMICFFGSLLPVGICCCCCCYCCCQKKTKKRLGCIYTRFDSCLGKKKSPTINATTAKPDENTSLPLSTEQPTIPNNTKRGKQTAEKSDMNELRDIPSSPDQDERSHPAKGSRDLPQPRAGGGGQGNVTHSSTPRSLLPVQAVTPLPSVERNSYAESRKLPLPSIDSKDAH